MSYSVKEMFYTLQGEGANSGRPSVFVRFAGCNLWSGQEQDRPTAICQFCDTNFVGVDGENGGKFADATELADAVARLWRRPTSGKMKPLVVCTGGEPLLQLDAAAIAALHAKGFEVAVETNGTQPAPSGLDWICVSPKADTALAITSGNELKLVFPQIGSDPSAFLGLDFDHFYLSPMDGPNQKRNTELAVRYCLENPEWRLNLQTHKFLGIP